ncbi:MAG: DnaA N-terminal domain-containing protein, partial [Tepidimonas sp.]|uniref:DnaA N-terminal domain-containing protein n=1 Tax=Tepidimonas sp. TaxID=2002775 RepID=UPI00405525B9
MSSPRSLSDANAAAQRAIPAASDLWSACVERLSQELPIQQVNTWIRPLVARVADDGSRVTLAVANRFKMDWVRAQYAGKIGATLQAIAGRPVAVELVLA